ncbi:hypothetical protein EDC44_101151 [Cricetibacter osteomyelitidis]|uniref:Uncharacterized protein n=1 Tax=Cricetibacter osteomyelitidis TaxID=1521931 RepID=A0A4R2TKE6_9PAST|nr:hypothetical protein [Cricetibacter osteomyelitidis]TCP97768.1 hypothetical protein EDC44_101151 [Cricetibacter osteomyelitidis]
MHYKKYQLQVHYLEPNYRPFYLSGGLAKLLSYEAVIGLFSDKKKYKTWEGQFANDPLLATIMMFAGHQVPAGGIEKAMLQAKDELINVADIKRNRSSKALIYRFFSQTPKMPPQISLFTQVKAALLNANSGLTLFSGLVEYGVYTESRYRGDKIGANAALLRSFGGVSVGTAYGALGLFAHNGVLANLAVLGLQGMLLVGAIALVAGVVMGFFSQKEMEAWIENGFWGTSTNYWGEAEEGYEWTIKREKSFEEQWKDSKLIYEQLDNGERKLEINAETIFEKYTIEMQRYFQFKEPIKLSKYESNSILVEHSSLMNPAMAQTIRISTLIVNTYWRCDNPVFSVEYLKEGRAVLHFSFPLNVRVNTYDDENISDSIPENEVKEMRIAISMADYQHSDKRFYSKLQVIKIT